MMYNYTRGPHGKGFVIWKCNSIIYNNIVHGAYIKGATRCTRFISVSEGGGSFCGPQSLPSLHASPIGSANKNAPCTHTDEGLRPSSVISLFLSRALLRTPPHRCRRRRRLQIFRRNPHIRNFISRFLRRYIDSAGELTGPACRLYHLFFNNCVQGARTADFLGGSQER